MKKIKSTEKPFSKSLTKERNKTMTKKVITAPLNEF